MAAKATLHPRIKAMIDAYHRADPSFTGKGKKGQIERIHAFYIAMPEEVFEETIRVESAFLARMFQARKRQIAAFNAECGTVHASHTPSAGAFSDGIAATHAPRIEAPEMEAA